METYYIEVKIEISGETNAADFILDLVGLVSDYDGSMEISEDSDVDVEFATSNPGEELE